MVELFTPVELPEGMPRITHAHRLMMLGSCFAENMGKQMAGSGFCCDINPMGILYNPFSACTALQRIADGTPFIEKDLFFSNGCWHSFMHHGSFSAPVSEDALAGMNHRLAEAHRSYGQLDWLVLTWGTAYVYLKADTGEVVSNCHKLPEKCFTRRRVEPGEIVALYRPVVERLLMERPELKILLTVSPIRHLRDGMHANQLSKSVLLLAADELCGLFPRQVFYFPSYEIVMDELRDYRYYADDMTHVSELTVRYLWERFSETFFDAKTKEIITEYVKIRKSLEHRPFCPDSEQYRRFLGQIVLKIERFREKYPNFAADFGGEVFYNKNK